VPDKYRGASLGKNNGPIKCVVVTDILSLIQFEKIIDFIQKCVLCVRNTNIIYLRNNVLGYMN
jgi:hypothetical protein